MCTCTALLLLLLLLYLFIFLIKLSLKKKIKESVHNRKSKVTKTINMIELRGAIPSQDKGEAHFVRPSAEQFIKKHFEILIYMRQCLFYNPIYKNYY